MRNEVEAPLVALALEQDRGSGDGRGSVEEQTSTAGRTYPAVARGLLIKFRQDGVEKFEPLFGFGVSQTFGTHEQCEMRLSRQAMRELAKNAHDVVIMACVAPIRAVLGVYATNSGVWVRQTNPSSERDIEDELAMLSPLPTVTAVGEQLFSLVPLLEHSGLIDRWLGAALQEVSQTVVAQVLQIPALSQLGFAQLLCDLEYVNNVLKALSGGGESDPKVVANEGGVAAGEEAPLAVLVLVLHRIDVELAGPGRFSKSKVFDLRERLVVEGESTTGGGGWSLAEKYNKTVKHMLLGGLRATGGGGALPQNGHYNIGADLIA